MKAVAAGDNKNQPQHYYYHQYHHHHQQQQQQQQQHCINHLLTFLMSSGTCSYTCDLGRGTGLRCFPSLVAGINMISSLLSSAVPFRGTPGSRTNGGGRGGGVDDTESDFFFYSKNNEARGSLYYQRFLDNEGSGFRIRLNIFITCNKQFVKCNKHY